MKPVKQWHAFSPAGKMLILLSGILQVGLLVAVLRDLKRRPSFLIRGRKSWWALVSFIDIAGPLAYFLLGRKNPESRKDFI